MAVSPISVFDTIVRTDLPERPPVLFDTVCVLGGSVAGLLAARVLADHARTVVIVERDTTNVDGRSRAGVAHDAQVHGLQPGGLAQVERWLPGFTQEARDLGGVLLRPDRTTMYVDGQEQLRVGDTEFLFCTRPFLESRIRSRVLALPNVETLTAQATGLEFDDDGGVTGVRHTVDGVAGTLPAEFVVDAMGRSSKAPEWVERAGFDKPPLQRMQTGVHYATALFERTGRHAEEPFFTGARFTLPPGPDGLAVALVKPVEGGQWLVGLTTHADGRAPRTIEEFRALCQKLPYPFGEVTGGAVTRAVLNFHQSDSRRRDFTGLSRYPSRLVSVGDSVASLNATYAQGMTSAAFHASCLSEYLGGPVDLAAPATGFFALQEVAVDAVWAVSAGSDAALRDAIEGAEVPEEVQKQRWGMMQLAQASLTDATIAEAAGAVFYGLAHPMSLGDPALLERALAVNGQGPAGS
ncbi:FAD-dependent monooxygenase [Streptomyces sp. NPDC005722]